MSKGPHTHLKKTSKSLHPFSQSCTVCVHLKTVNTEINVPSPLNNIASIAEVHIVKMNVNQHTKV